MKIRRNETDRHIWRPQSRNEKGGYDELYLLQVSYDSAVIDSQELVCRSGHVDILVFAFLPFTVKKLVYKVISGRVLNDRGLYHYRILRRVKLGPQFGLVLERYTP